VIKFGRYYFYRVGQFSVVKGGQFSVVKNSAGPTVKRGTTFGYIARPSFGDDYLAKVIEMMTIYNFSKNLSGSLYWGHVFGKTVIENIYAGDEDGDYFSTEFKIKF